MSDQQTKQQAPEEENYGMPPNWVPVDAAPVVPHDPPPAPLPNYQVAVLPPGAQHDVSFVAAGKTSPDIPKTEILPLTNNATVGSQIISGINKNPALQANIQQTTQNTTNIVENTNAIETLQALSFQGAYSATVSYSAGASVDSGGIIYISLVDGNLGNTPASSPTDWQAVGGTASYAGIWSGTASYTIGQTVSVSSSLYIALQNSTNENPTTTTGYWALISGSTIFYGAYSGTAVYPAGAEVSYNGSFWIAVSAVPAGNTPAPGSSYWENVGTAAILLAAYSGSVTYSIGMEVVGSDGNVYQWINATPASGQAPPNATYWQLVGPENLGSIANGPSSFAGTAGSLSYRPTTNPLTSVNAGSSATVDVAAFTMATTQGNISLNSGTITSLSYGTLYYIYYSDPTLAGGTVTYLASTSQTTAINPAYFFVGSIVTAVSGGPTTVGNSDGGVGAQSGSSNVLLGGATAVAVPGGTASGAVTNPSYAIDGNSTTYADITINDPSGAAADYANLTVSGISPTQAILGTMTLFIRSSASVTIGGTAYATSAYLKYSLDGGASYTTVYDLTTTTQSRALTTDSVVLSLSQNTALIRVIAGVTSGSGGNSVAEVKLYEAYAKYVQ
jgi:hypothetical protein